MGGTIRSPSENQKGLCLDRPQNVVSVVFRNALRVRVARQARADVIECFRSVLGVDVIRLRNATFLG